MGSSRLLPWMFVIATTVAVRVPICHRPLGQASVPGMPSMENCLCPVGPPTILNSLDPGNAGVERLVIIFYRKLDTGEIISFIPQKEIQHQIPDFPEEYGLVIEISDHPNFMEMFESSASREIRQTVDLGEHESSHSAHPEIIRPGDKETNEVVIVVDTQRPKDLNIIPGNNQKHLHEHAKAPSWLIPVHADSENNIPHSQVRPLPKDSENNNLHIQVKPLPQYLSGSNEYPTTDIPSNNVGPYEDTPDHYLTEDYSTPEEINVEPNEDDSYKPLHDHENPINLYNSLPLEHSSSDSKPLEGIYEEQPTYENESNRDIEESSSGPSKPRIQVRPLNPTQNPYVPNDHLEVTNGRDVISPPKIQTIIVPRKDHHGRIVGWTTQTVKSYWESSSNTHHLVGPQTIVHPVKLAHKVLAIPQVIPFSHNYISDRNDNNEPYENISSFEYWLKDQLNITTINGNKIPTSTDDIKVLQAEIRNVLLQNGLIVTKQGTLIDGHGKESSLENLKLRPILIGKSMSYNHFLKHIGSDVKFKIPSNTPFLEGLLLTMIKPPKILGIVPLSITSLPHKHGHEHGDNEITIQGHVQPVQEKALLKILPISQLVSFRKHSPVIKETMIEKKHSVPKVTLISRHSQHKTDSNDLREALAAITKKAEKESDTWARWKSLGKPTKERTSAEVPDFRIIGGISATVSGTPLLNRGRSGFESTL